MDRRLDFLAASPSFSMSLDSASVHFSFLKSDLEECLGLLSRMLLEPAFEEKKIQEALALKKEELRRIADDPQKLAFREFNRLLYPGDPRGRYATSASIQNISRADLAAFHREYFSPANMLLAVSGDISREEAVEKIEQAFSDATIPRRVHELPDAPKQRARHFSDSQGNTAIHGGQRGADDQQEPSGLLRFRGSGFPHRQRRLFLPDFQRRPQ